MKQISIILFTLYCSVSVAQHKSDTITFDFKTKEISFPENKARLKKGDHVWIKVKNYNPYLYRVVVNNTDSTVYAFGDSGALNWFLDPTNLSAIAGNISALNISPLLNGGQKIMVEQSGKEFMVPLSKSNNFLQSLLKSSDDSVIITKKATDATVAPTVEEKLKQHQKLTESLYAEITTQKEKLENSLYTYSRLNAFLLELIPDGKNFTGISAKVQIIESGFMDLRKEVASLKVKITHSHNQYNTGVLPFITESYRNAHHDVRFGDSLIRKFYAEANAFIEKMETTSGYMQQKKFIDAIESLQLLSPTYTSAPLFFTSNLKKFTIDVKPWGDSTKLPSYSTTFQLPWSQKNIWGVTGGIYISGLHSKGYSAEATIQNADTSYTFRDDNPGKFEFGINALAYVGWRMKEENPWYLGGSFGTGFSIESKPKPRMFAGISALFGDNSRIVLSLGATIGYVQRLSSLYEDKKQIPATEKYMKDALKCNAFFSINYSFLNK